MITFLNLLTGFGVIAAAFAGLAGGLIVGIAGILFGILNLINAYRRRIKAWITYAVFWAMLYIGGLISIAAIDHQRFSLAISVWVIFFLGITELGIWVLGGIQLDMTILISSLSDEDFNKLMTGLGNNNNNQPGTQTVLVSPSVFHPVDRLLYYFRQVVHYPHEMILFFLPLWRQMGQNFFRFLKFANMVAVLIGMYFLYFPPSGNWKMFGLVCVSFVGFAISGSNFNWNLWRKVTIASMIFGTIWGTLSTFVSSVNFDKLMSVDNIPYLAIVLFIAYLSLNFIGPSKPSATPAPSQESHHGH